MVSRCSIDDLPLDKRVDVRILGLLYCFKEFCRVSSFTVLERIAVAVVPGFELGSGAPDIVFSAGARVDGSFVNNDLLATSTVERAVSLFSAITCGDFG